MQNKGAIKFFAILFALVCLFQLSFTFKTYRVEKKAKEYANNEEVMQQAKQLAKGDVLKENFYIDSLSRARERYFLDSMMNEVVFNIGVRKYTYKECKEREINLGLDLKGGMNVTLEVSMVDIIRTMSGHSKDSTFNKAIELALQKQKNSQTDFVTLFAESFNQIDKNAKLAAIFSYELKDKIKVNSTNEEVIAAIREETNSAFDRTFQILRQRIDKFGVTQPNIQKLSQSERILVELPGVKDPERVRKLLQGTAQLEFWETFDFKEIAQNFVEADKLLAKAQNFSVDADSLMNLSDTISDINKKDSLLAENKTDTSGKSLVDKIKSKDTTKGKNKDEMTREQWIKEHPLFHVLQLNVDEKNIPRDGPVVGMAYAKDIPKIERMLEYAKKALPHNIKLLWTAKPIQDKTNIYQLVAIKVSSRDGTPALGGDVITDARQDFDQNGNNEITMSMNAEGAKIWKNLTAANIKKSIAIVLDNLVYSYPTVNQEISGGRSSISGRFTLEEAKDLANILKAGKLPAPAKIVQEAVVGPSLGKESINASMISFIFAFLMVLLYMYFFYNGVGLIANIALLANIFFLMGVLSSLGAVLTLPGIAGIVLTLGMAVDANVIIYERIKEEVRAGKGVRLAISDGYKNAYSAIIDGNVTTLLTGIVLYIFGSGPVQGFATTLCIGILTSLFSAIFITRLIITWMMDHDKKITYGNKLTINFLSNTKFDFVKARKVGYIISIALIVISALSLGIKGVNYGVDFKGGRTFVVRFDQNVKLNDVRASLTKEFGETPEVKTFGPDNQIKVTTKYGIDSRETVEMDSIVAEKLYNGLKGFYKKPIDKVDFLSENQDKPIGRLSSEMVGPTIADDIRQAAVWAVFFALIIIFVYVAIRFKRWEYGLGGVVALFHDAFITLGVFSLFNGILPFNMEVDQALIAALLTIIGYSINDTVIIFDRIREYIGLYPKRELEVNLNGAINSTLARTINTAGTTLVVLLMIFMFGGDVIRGFTFALLFGITIGTYSSVFIASSIAYDIITKRSKKKLKSK
jgi:SecD/SecF fusion protein